MSTNLVSVSYTHLDVYKRQVLTNELGRNTVSALCMKSSMHVAVKAQHTLRHTRITKVSELDLKGGSTKKGKVTESDCLQGTTTVNK